MYGPNLILLAGPNGAGKTTASSDLLAGAPGVHHFVNADEIALAFESTLATRSFAPWIRSLKDSGYSFNLFYFWLRTPEMAIERVRLRKTLGGHSVPEVDIRRRYHRGLQNFFKIYRPLATAWEFYDNTQSDPRLIAAGDPEAVNDQDLWARIRKEADRGNSE